VACGLVRDSFFGSITLIFGIRRGPATSNDGPPDSNKINLMRAVACATLSYILSDQPLYNELCPCWRLLRCSLKILIGVGRQADPAVHTSNCRDSTKKGRPVRCSAGRYHDISRRRRQVADNEIYRSRGGSGRAISGTTTVLRRTGAGDEADIVRVCAGGAVLHRRYCCCGRPLCRRWLY
jgi:hypothetical protein